MGVEAGASSGAVMSAYSAASLEGSALFFKRPFLSAGCTSHAVSKSDVRAVCMKLAGLLLTVICSTSCTAHCCGHRSCS